MDSPNVQKNILYRFAFSKILVIILVSLLSAGLVLSVANDLFAFVKPTQSITVEVAEPMPLHELSQLLQNRGVIDNSLAFWAYAKLKGGSQLEDFYGSVELNSDMGYRDILNKLKNF